MSVGYVESSALAKLVLDEPESDPLRAHLRDRDRLVSSELTAVEVGRAARRERGDAGLARLRVVVLPIAQLSIDRRVLSSATELDPPTLRSLDAIHVATALALESPDVVFYSYDRRTIEAAEANGLTVASPGA